MSESKFFKTHMRSNNTSCEVYNYFMFAVCFKIVLLIPTSLHQKCIITEPKLMKIKRSKIYNNSKSIIVN